MRGSGSVTGGDVVAATSVEVIGTSPIERTKAGVMLELSLIHI